MAITCVKCPVSEEKPSPWPYLQPRPSAYQLSSAALYRSPPILGKGRMTFLLKKKYWTMESVWFETYPKLEYRFSPVEQCWKTPLLAIPSAHPWALAISCKEVSC